MSSILFISLFKISFTRGGGVSTLFCQSSADDELMFDFCIFSMSAKFVSVLTMRPKSAML